MMRATISILVIPVICLTASVFACGDTPDDDVRQTPPALGEPETADDPDDFPIQNLDYQNRTYNLGSLGQWEFTNGESRGEMGAVASVEGVTYGLFNGRFGEHAAVTLRGNWGGGNFYSDIIIIADEHHGDLEVLATIETPRTKSIWFEGGILAIQYLERAPEDALCCPSISTVEIWQWDGLALVLRGKQSTKQ